MDAPSVLREFLDWRDRTLQRNRGDDYLNGEIDRQRNPRKDGADGWDDLDEICRRAREALRNLAP